MSDVLTISAARCAWRIERRVLDVDGEPRTLRLARFEAGWLASADSVEGPTLGADRSPFLAVRRALEPLGIGAVEAMAMLGRLDLG